MWKQQCLLQRNRRFRAVNWIINNCVRNWCEVSIKTLIQTHTPTHRFRHKSVGCQTEFSRLRGRRPRIYLDNNSVWSSHWFVSEFVCMVFGSGVFPIPTHVYLHKWLFPRKHISVGETNFCGSRKHISVGETDFCGSRKHISLGETDFCGGNKFRFSLLWKTFHLHYT